VTFTVEIRRSAVRDLEGLPVERRVLVGKRIDALGQDPRPVGSVRIRGSDGFYRVRSGDYRILYTIDDAERRVTIWYVRHRGIAYRR